MKGELRHIISGFMRKGILILGDIILDQYFIGHVSRISPEAPVPVLALEKVFYSPGGAANVAMNVSSLGGKAYLVGVIGDDSEGEQLGDVFTNNGVNIDGLKVDPSRPTTLKTRIIARSQHMVRVDREKTDAIDEILAQELLDCALEILDAVDVVVVSDYAKGVIVLPLLRGVISKARRQQKKIIIDPKGRDFSKYCGASIVTPNQHEAGVMVNRESLDEEGLRSVADSLLSQLECEAVLITRGEEGMSLFQSNGIISHLPTVAQEVYDVTGAGDTVMATLALASAVGANWETSARIANLAAGIAVSKAGTASVSSHELIAACVAP